MDAISTKILPTGSETPPMSPFSWVNRYPSQPLPPLRSLPTWSRTKISANKKILTVQPNRKLKLELVENVSHVDCYTQTSPPESRGSSSVSSITFSPLKSLKNTQCHSSDKNIRFLQTNHKFVLSNLHQEVEKLKSDNKDLQFQLIMTDGGSRFPTFHHQTNNKNVIDNENNQARVLRLIEEIKTLENSLKKEQSQNRQLVQQINNIKERSTSTHQLPDKKKKHGCQEQGIITHLSNEAPDSAAKAFHNNASSNTAVFDSKVSELKQFTKEQETELLQLREKLQDSSNREKSNTILPRLKQRNRSGKTHPTLNAEMNFTSQKLKAPFSLPTLQPLHWQKNLTSRQKRAQAAHVQRQRSNKGISLLCDK